MSLRERKQQRDVREVEYVSMCEFDAAEGREVTAAATVAVNSLVW